MEDVPVGDTKPKRAFLRQGPGGSFVFKELMPSRKSGLWESYKSEIAAYELDKMLGMGMVPPTVERKYDGVTGSAQLWVEHCTLLRDNDTSKAPDIAAWNKHVYWQRVWDNLDRQHRPQPGQPADGSGLEPDPDRSLPRVHGGDDDAVSDAEDRPGVLHQAQGVRRGHTEGAVGNRLLARPKPILKRRDKTIQSLDQMIAQWGEAGVFVK